MMKLVFILLVNTIIISANDIVELKDGNFISIKGTINEKTTNKFMIDASQLSSDIDDIYIYIHSGGGSVMDGMRIIEYMKVLEDTYTVHCISDYSASMAFVILQYCQHRHTTISSLLMQHQMSLGVKNNLFNMNNYLDMINKMNINIDNTQAKRIGLTYEDFKNKITNDWWIYGTDTVEENVSDDIISIKCHQKLYKKTETVNVETFFGDIKITFNYCPLVRYPISIKYNKEHFEDMDDADNYIQQSIRDYLHPHSDHRI